MPRQTPRSGRPVAAKAFTASSSPRARSPSIASPKAPTPGRITRSAWRTTAGSEESAGAPPTLATAWHTLKRLPRP